MSAINLKKDEKPKGWEICFLPDFTHIEMGQSPPSTTYNHEGVGLPFFQGKAEFTDLYPEIDKYCSEPKKIADAGATLLSVRAPVGPTNLAEVKCCIGRGLAGIHPLDKIECKFILYFMRSIEHDISDKGTGSTFTAINKDFLNELTIALPPLNEQRRIVVKIEELFSELDKGIESLKAARSQLKVYRHAVLKRAFEGKLTADWRTENLGSVERIEETLAKVESPPRPNRWKTRSKDVIPGHAALAINDPGLALPDGWAWVKLVDVARMETGHTPSRKHPEWWQGDVKWIGIADARPRHGKVISETSQHTNDDGLANSAARLLPEGTVCVSRTASVGYVVTMGTEMATSQDFVNWVPTEAVTSEWLNLIFSADRETLRRFGKGTTHKTIYFPEWMAVSIALPSVAEQLEIVERVQEIFSILENQEEIIATSLDQSEALRQSILKSAFSGKLVEQDPNGEPASELLERIKAEKEESEKGKKVKKGKAA